MIKRTFIDRVNVHTQMAIPPSTVSELNGISPRDVSTTKDES